jgi:N-acyl amino acid synthase of PEP-CTERM/exosortase system
MEPTLLRMLQRLGIYFENMGPVVDYHGQRQPCFCSVDDLLATTWEQRPDVWSLVTDDGRLCPQRPPVIRQNSAARAMADVRNVG